MKISVEWLEENNACSNGKKWFGEQKETDGLEVIKKLIVEKQLSWANWLIVRLMTHKQKVQYAVFAAENFIDLFDKKYPDDKRPRKAIDTAKTWIEDPSEENRKAAAAAADAAAYATADAAAYAAADAAAAAAADAAYAATAYAAAAADAAAYAAAAAAYAAAVAKAAAADAAMRIKILEYGIKLLEKK